MTKRHRAGFICPPTSFDTSPMSFLKIAPEGVETMQTQMRLSGMGHTMATFSLDTIHDAVPEVKECARGLADSGVEVVIQFGAPFSLVHGGRALDVQREIADHAGVPVVLCGTAMIEAVAHLGAKRVAVAASYYDDTWTPRIHGCLREAGLDVPYMENWVTQGVVASQAEADKAAWDFDPAPARAGVLATAEAQPDADVIFVLGGGVYVIDLAAELEAQIGKPVLGADVAMFWRAFQHLGVAPRTKGHGMLLDSLG